MDVSVLGNAPVSLHRHPHDLDHIVGERVGYYNTIRSHTERSHLPPVHAVPDEVSKPDRDQIVVRSSVGGLVKPFEQKAA